MTNSAARARLGAPRTALFAALAAGLGLLLIEGACRLVEVARDSVPFEARSQLSHQQLPSGPLLVPVQGFPDLLSPAPGLTDNPVIIRPRAPGELRVLVLGGSAVGGWSVASRATFPAVLEEALADVRPGPVTVLNFGRTGYSSAQLAHVARQTAARIQPDVILAVTGNNERHDLAVEAESRGSADRVIARRELLRRSALARLLRPAPAPLQTDPRRGDGAHEPPIAPPQPERIGEYAAERLTRSLGSLADTADHVGATLLLATVATNHRHRPVGHEWSFMEPASWRGAPLRAAYFALRFGAWDRGLAALEGRDDVDSTLLRGVLLHGAGRIEEARGPLSAIAGAEWSLPPDIDRAIPWLWSKRLLEGEESSRDALRHGGDRIDAPPTSPEDACDQADLRWYAGDWEAARAAYAACRVQAFPYRADDVINGAIAAAAADLSAPLIDLDAAARARSPHGVPEYDLFYDYCHYTPLGNVFAGHTLAAGLAAALGEPTPQEPAAAEAAFLERWRGAPHDELEFPRWVGVGADIAALAVLRYGTRRIEHDDGPPGSWESLVFVGNRAADRGSPADLRWFELAAASWCRALAMHPTRREPEANLATMLRGPAGPHLRGFAGWDAVERCKEGQDPWSERALPSLDEF